MNIQYLHQHGEQRAAAIPINRIGNDRTNELKRRSRCAGAGSARTPGAQEAEGAVGTGASSRDEGSCAPPCSIASAHSAGNIAMIRDLRRGQAAYAALLRGARWVAGRSRDRVRAARIAGGGSRERAPRAAHGSSFITYVRMILIASIAWAACLLLIWQRALAHPSSPSERFQWAQPTHPVSCRDPGVRCERAMGDTPPFETVVSQPLQTCWINRIGWRCKALWAEVETCAHPS